MNLQLEVLTAGLTTVKLFEWLHKIEVDITVVFIVRMLYLLLESPYLIGHVFIDDMFCIMNLLQCLCTLQRLITAMLCNVASSGACNINFVP